MHYLSQVVLDAERLSPGKVKARLKTGWKWHRLDPGFGACGGAASYSRALVSPDGVVAFVSDRADGMGQVACLPVLPISYQLLSLSVPFAEKERAKKLGAVWIGHKKIWACAPDQEERFSQWIENETLLFDLLQD